MDEIEQLEAELLRLQPRTLSPALEHRIAQELAATALNGVCKTHALRLPVVGQVARPRRSWWVATVALPIAAAIALLLAVSRRGSAPLASRDVLKPVSAENLLLAVSDEGTVTLPDGTTATRERLQYLDTIRWANPQTHASLTMTVPREEVRVTPLSYQ